MEYEVLQSSEESVVHVVSSESLPHSVTNR
jgi:hypothetical protein